MVETKKTAETRPLPFNEPIDLLVATVRFVLAVVTVSMSARFMSAIVLAVAILATIIPATIFFSLLVPAIIISAIIVPSVLILRFVLTSFVGVIPSRHRAYPQNGCSRLILLESGRYRGRGEH